MPASPFQASGETSPGKNDDLPRTIAGSTPLPLGRRSFAVSGPLAPVRSASYPVPVRRLTGSFHASFSVRLTTNALRFPSVPATRFREDFHLQVIAHAGPTTEITPQAAGPAQPPPGGEPGGRGLAPALTVGPEDILELVVVLDSVPAGPGSVRVRVDGLGEPGLVTFFMPPPTAAAAGMALQPPATFQGCAAVAPAGIELRAPEAPRSKVWVRVSSDRPVRVRPRVPNRSAELVVVMPGTSEVVGWREE